MLFNHLSKYDKRFKNINPSTKPKMGELEQTAQRLAGEFNIVISETNASGISYEKELEGQNGEQSMHYLQDAQIEGYEIITAARQDNAFKISLCEGEYLIILKAYGQNLLNALKKKPHKKGIEVQLLAGIANQLITLKKQPEKLHEICADINEAELNTISRKTIEKYLS